MNPEQGHAGVDAVEIKMDGTTSEAQLMLGLIHQYADPRKRAEIRASIRRELERDSVRDLKDRPTERFTR